MAESIIRKGFSFPIGDTLRSEDGIQYTITGYLGKGGQGEVYRVKGIDGEYAIKWYHADRCLSKIDADAFYKNLKRNVENGIPQLTSGASATQFIWPLRMIERRNGSFGYLMKIFPTGYESLKNVIFLEKRDSVTGKKIALRWSSWFIRITAALNIVRAFEILHKSGLSYQDLNDGGISINMETGDALICDCDNVSPDKTNLGIRGIMEYMAPEVVTGKKLPDRLTDQYSLAVILFRLFFHDHPMKGIESMALHNSDHLSQHEADIRIFGSQPHYCLASNNNKNPPDKILNSDVLKLCRTYPMSLMNAFEQVFTKGVADPIERLTATQWRKVLLDVRDHLIQVNGQEHFYDTRVRKILPEECRTLVYPNGREVLCMPGKIIYKYHMDEFGTDYKTPVGKIIPTAKPGIIGMYNATGKTIQVTQGDKKLECPHKGRMPLLPGMTLTIDHFSIQVK